MIYLFIWLYLVLVVAHEIFGIQTLSCSCEPLPVPHDLVPWPGIELGPPALGAWSLSQWTTREVPLWSTKCAITLYLRKKCPYLSQGFPGGSLVKNPPANTGDMGLIPVSRRSPEEANGSPFQYSCLGNLMDRGTWQATVHGVAKSRTLLNN